MIAVRNDNGDVVLSQDELIRHNATPEAMTKLKPLVSGDSPHPAAEYLIRNFGGVSEISSLHHPGSAPGMVDGAALALLASRAGAERCDLPIRARIRACAVANGEVALALTGGIEAAKRALAAARMTTNDIDLWEFNEGFAAIPMRFARELDVPLDRLNVNGGGIAMGHAMGATGINLVGIVLDELERRDLNTGLIAISGAAGIGGAIILERVKGTGQ
jgi:acetyl-CoA C-acetyltransferase